MKVISSVCLNCLNALRSVKFWVSVALYLAVMFYFTSNFWHEDNVLDRLADSLEFSTREVLILISAVPAASYFVGDWCSGRFIFSYTRAKKRSYTASVVLSAFFTALMVCAIAMTIYIFLLNVFLSVPFVSPRHSDDLSNTSVALAFANGGLFVDGHIFVYLLLVILTQGCCMGLFSASATVVSVFFTNSYIATVSSMVLYSLSINLLRIFERTFVLLTSPFNVLSMLNYVIQAFNPNFDPKIDKNFSVISMLYPYIYTAVLLIVLIFAAHFLIKRKYESKSDLN